MAEHPIDPLVWVPVLLGVGAWLYFLLPLEPPTWITATMAMAAGFVASAVWWKLRTSQALRWAVLALAWVIFGLALADVRVAMIGTRTLDSPARHVTLTGQITEVGAGRSGARIVVADVRITGQSNGVPSAARITLPNDTPPAVGTRVSMRATLLPLPTPAAPGAYDFARRAYLDGIGAIGWAEGDVVIIEDREARSGIVERIRQSIAERINARLSGDVAALAIALTVGDRRDLSEDATEALRASGLAHLLAISGLHMGLVTGAVFFLVRAMLALIPPLALRRPIKKWAAFVALSAGAGYLILSGGSVPTVRAFIMAALVLGGVMLDRRAISMRTVALAACVIVVSAPESVLDPGFQLSFAAVVALVAAYEAWSARLGQSRSWIRQQTSGRLLAYVLGVVATTLIASTATTPISIATFHRVAAYSLAGNVVAVPLTALIVMPAAVIATALMPFGLEAPALAVMGMGLDGVLATARWVSSHPDAVLAMASPPAWAVASVHIGGLTLALTRGRWRGMGLLPLAVGLMAFVDPPRPDLLIDSGGRQIAVRARDGHLALHGRVSPYVGSVWLERDGDSSTAAEAKQRDAFQCRTALCWAALPSGARVAEVRIARGFDRACREAAIVVSRLTAPSDCAAPLVIDGARLARDGTVAVYDSGNGVDDTVGFTRFTVRTVSGWRGERPWTPRMTNALQ